MIHDRRAMRATGRFVPVSSADQTDSGDPPEVLPRRRTWARVLQPHFSLMSLLFFAGALAGDPAAGAGGIPGEATQPPAPFW